VNKDYHKALYKLTYTTLQIAIMAAYYRYTSYKPFLAVNKLQAPSGCAETKWNTKR